ncbi:O-linked N-acetylglucosamine transferase, SPINDLY family protein, partial [Yokenella regensburgei]
SCQGQEILRIYGLDAFVASDKASYIDKALYRQTHLDELDAIRQSIRSKIQQTTDTNVVEPFQRAVREAWRHWCAQEQPRSFTVTA